MKKILKLFLKIIGISAISIISLTLLADLWFTIFIGPRPSPNIKQLENACGVHFPPFRVIEKDSGAGSHMNYFYTVRFKQPLGEDVINRIEYLCKYGEKLDIDGCGVLRNPWESDNGHYSFGIDEMFDRGSYVLPRGCRIMDIILSDDFDIMYVNYMMYD